MGRETSLEFSSDLALLPFLSNTAKKRKSDKVRAGTNLREIWAKDWSFPWGRESSGILNQVWGGWVPLSVWG